jgi:hypothetical protein
MKLALPISRRLLFFTLAIALIVAAIDFPLRVLMLRDSAARSFAKPSLSSVPKASTKSLIDERLKAWFPQPPPPEKPAERSMSLAGVFAAGGQIRAMVQLGPFGDLPPQYVTVGVTEPVSDGWVLETIDGQRVVLRRNAEVRELTVFRMQLP